jgi:hypothetical protein
MRAMVGGVWMWAVACAGPSTDVVARSGITANVCAAPGAAAAFVATTETVDGPDALTRAGDAVLMNDRVAFVLQDPASPRTYYHYGGIPVDAVPLRDCAQSGPERLGEVGLAVGRLELLDFVRSELRQIEGTAMRVVDPGGPGRAAVVEVDATDGRFWLVEDELIRSAYKSGNPKRLSPLWGLDITLRYTLPPDSEVLDLEVEVRAGSDGSGGYLVGVLNFPSDRTEDLYWANEGLSFGGFTLDAGLPFYGLSGESSYAIAPAAGRLARAEVSGAVALLNLDEVFSPLSVDEGAAPVARWKISAVAGDVDDAALALLSQIPEAVPGRTTSFGSTLATVSDPAGAPVPDAVVEAQLQRADGTWRAITRSRTDVSGLAEVATFGFGDLASVRLVASAEGRAPSVPVAVVGADTSLTVGPAGAAQVVLTDASNGEEIPARLEWIDADGVVQRRTYAVPGDAPVAIPPGAWRIRATRGYEWSIGEAVVTVPEDGEVEVAVSLDHLVDTTGWLSMDSHVHQEPSADSRTSEPDRLKTVAATGLDVVIATDHEIIRSRRMLAADAALSSFLAVVSGQEVTATTPEHINAWPFPDPAPGDVRGNIPRWYGLGLGETFAVIRERGAELVQLNHPRFSCNWMCLIGWDRATGEPQLSDPTLLGLEPTMSLWSWDFDVFEVMNGLKSPLIDPEVPDASGLFEDWLAFHDHGHPVTAVGVTDAHDAELPGSPRTYFAAVEEDMTAFDEAAMVEALRGRRALVSAGAFARVAIDGAGPGETVRVSGTASLTVHVEALPQIDVDHVTVLVNGIQVASVPTDDPDGVVKLDLLLPLSFAEDAHVVVVGWGANPMPEGFYDYDPTGTPRFFSNAILVDADGVAGWQAPGWRGGPVFDESRVSPPL